MASYILQQEHYNFSARTAITLRCLSSITVMKENETRSSLQKGLVHCVHHMVVCVVGEQERGG